MIHNEKHKLHRVAWLRAAVLGANDGIISTSSLIIGVAMADADRSAILIAGIAGLTAGAMSMAAGEYVSVSSQADIEKAEILLEQKHLEEHSEYEKIELAKIYINRGIKPELAHQVAEQLMEHDALGAHMRDELGISLHPAQPIQAALVSATTFTLGASLPLAAFYLTPHLQPVSVTVCSSLLSLTLLGGLAAYSGGASILKGAVRVMFWGALAMLLTGLIGNLFS